MVRRVCRGGIRDWSPDDDTWELYNLDEDWTQNRDLAAQHPQKLAQLRELFAIEAAKNNVLPIGGGLWVTASCIPNSGSRRRTPSGSSPATHPDARVLRSRAGQQEQPGHPRRSPSRTKPSGVLYALGGNAGGLTCFVDDGYLCYEYNLFILMRTKIRVDAPMPPGRERSRWSRSSSSPGPVAR